MNISIEDLKTERQWRSATEYDKERFTNLLKLFENALQTGTYPCPHIRDRGGV